MLSVFEDIEKAKKTIFKKSGINPSIVRMSQEMYDKVKTHCNITGTLYQKNNLPKYSTILGLKVEITCGTGDVITVL